MRLLGEIPDDLSTIRGWLVEEAFMRKVRARIAEREAIDERIAREKRQSA